MHKSNQRPREKEADLKTFGINWEKSQHGLNYMTGHYYS